MSFSCANSQKRLLLAITCDEAEKPGTERENSCTMSSVAHLSVTLRNYKMPSDKRLTIVFAFYCRFMKAQPSKWLRNIGLNGYV